jgi:hypothetical protein
MCRRVSIEELMGACRRIDPNAEDLGAQARTLMGRGRTLAMALVRIAEGQFSLRKAAGLAPPVQRPSDSEKRGA